MADYYKFKNNQPQKRAQYQSSVFGKIAIGITTPVQRNTHIGACVIPQHRRVNIIARTGNDTDIYHALYALVNGRTRDTAFGSYFLKGDACVACNDFQDLFVQTVYLLHYWIFDLGSQVWP